LSSDRGSRAEAAIIDATLVQSTAFSGSHIDTPQDRAEEDAPDDPPDDPDVHFSTDTQVRWVRNGAKPTLGYKVTSRRLCPPGRGKLHRQGPHGHLRTGPIPRFDTMVKGANAQADIGRQGLCASKANRDALRGGRHRDRIMRTDARPSSTPACPGKTRGQAGRSPNAACGIEQCLCHDEAPPDISGWPKKETQLAMATIRQNLQGAPSTRKHRQSHHQTAQTALPDVRPADRTE